MSEKLAYYVVTSIEAHIASNDGDEVQARCALLDFQTMTFDVFQRLFIRFFLLAKMHKALGAGKALVDVWQSQSNIYDNRLAFSTYLFFLHPAFDAETFRFAAKAMAQETSAALHLRELMDSAARHTEQELVTVGRRIVDAYGKVTVSQDLLTDARNTGMELLVDFVRELMVRFTAPPPPPDWVKNLSVSDPLPTHAELMQLAVDIVTVHPSGAGNAAAPVDLQAEVTKMLAKLRKLGVHLEKKDEARKHVIGTLQAMTPAQQRAFVQGAQPDSEMFPDHHRKLQGILGPVNGVADTISDHRCCRFYGCRMLTCECFTHDAPDFVATDDDDDRGTPGWFTGQCTECGQRIAQFWHALRMPMSPEVGAGWGEAYCSLKCITEHVKDVGQQAFVTAIFDSICLTGIQDRRL